ncbi:MAG: NYN domain-containing protein [Betaproteobacteria bacterium]|nr:NYN domain-containing protein [Betaproteobacteria bacterium]
MRTAIYIDGFNLYYRAVRGTPYKWLDLKKVCQKLLQPEHVIVAIKYYTAPVSGKRDPGQPIRQQTFLRALKATIPEFTVQQGHFLTHEVSAPLARPAPGQAPTVRVLKTEEKGSDVNLAVHLLNDAWLNVYDCAVIISNDSDLAESMRLIRLHHPTKKIGLIFPRQGGAGARHAHPSRELTKHAHFVKHLGQTVLAACQLPNPIPGTTINKPTGW